MDKPTYDVFISYSRHDYVDDHENVIPNNEVSKIMKALTDAGITYWIDKEGIHSGDKFTEELPKIIRSAPIFVYLSTANANKSKYTSKEIAIADEYGKYIIPVRIDMTPYSDKVIFRIADVSFIKYAVNPAKGREDLVKSIMVFLKKKKENELKEEKEVEIEWAKRKSFKLDQEKSEKTIINGEKCLAGSAVRNNSITHSDVSLLRRRHDPTEHYGYVNEDGNYVIPPVWKWIPNAILMEADCTFVQDDFGMWGLLDGMGRIVSPCIWDDIHFSGGRKFAAVKNGEKWGIINDKGIIIIDYTFDELNYEVYWEAYCVRKDNKWGIIKTNGEVIAPCEYDEFPEFVHRNVYKSSKLFIIQKNGLWGGIDDKGCIKIPFVWKEISDRSPFKNLIKVKDTNDKWGVIDSIGRAVILPKWKKIDDNMSDGLVAVEDGNGKYGYINDVGSVVVQCKYWDAQSFSEGLAYARDNEGRGFINTNGEFVVREDDRWEVNSSYQFRNGIAIVYTWNKETSECFYGCINTEGELVIPLVWDYIWRSADDRMWVRDKNDQWGVIDEKGNAVVPCQYKKDKDVDFFFQCSFSVFVDAHNRRGVFGEQGNLIVPFGDWKEINLPWNDSIFGDFINTISVQDKTGKYGFYDINGRKITQFIWNNKFLLFSKWTGLASVQGENEKFGYIDLNGKLVIPCVYNNTFRYDTDIQGYLIEDENGICRYIDTNGNCIK